MNHKTLFIACAALSFSVAVVADPFVSPKEPSAKLIMNHTIPTKHLFKLNLTQINGENIVDRGSVVWVKPGDYDLKFRATVEQKHTKGHLRRINNGSRGINNEMNISLEAGKTYYMAYDAKARNADHWKPVVYKTE